MMVRHIQQIVVLIGVVATSGAEAAALQNQSGSEIPWPAKIGLRAAQIEATIPVVDRVVLVPDGPTYLDEVSRWSPQGQWPVLIEDDHFAPMFIRRFQPAEVVSRSSIRAAGEAQPTREEREKALAAAVVRAWNGDPDTDNIQAAFTRHQYIPPGVVIAGADDPAWTAALALAIGRGQPLLFLPNADTFGDPNETLDAARARQLVERIEALVASTGYQFASLGDHIDVITLCLSVAGKTNAPVPPERQFKRDGVPQIGNTAITDLIGRTNGGPSWAYTGWIFGNETRSAYVAMCSLFLERRKLWLCNTYDDGEGYRVFAIDEAAEAFKAAGFDVRHMSRDAATDAAWTRMLAGGIDPDVFMVNTQGMEDEFVLFGGQKASFLDVPVLNVPAVVHFVHSWSMKEPENPATIANAWLDRGAYVYVGAVEEPFLFAFTPPMRHAQLWTNFVPFLVASRWFEGDGLFYLPWRVNTFGDPLMHCFPPNLAPRLGARAKPDAAPDPRTPFPRRARLTPSPLPEGSVENVNEAARRLLRESESDATGATLARAIRTLELLGRDDLSLAAWQLAEQRDQAGACAEAALQALFRARRTREFQASYERLETRSERAQTMLWHLFIGRTGPNVDRDALLLLQTSVRQPRPDLDLRRLAPQLRLTFGEAHAQRAIEREINRASSPQVVQALQELLQRMR